MLDAYLEIAVSKRRCEFFHDDDHFYCEIPSLPGVWAQGTTPDACVEELREVLVDWVQIGIEKGLTVPILNGIELTAADVY